MGTPSVVVLSVAAILIWASTRSSYTSGHASSYLEALMEALHHARGADGEH